METPSDKQERFPSVNAFAEANELEPDSQETLELYTERLKAFNVGNPLARQALEETVKQA